MVKKQELYEYFIKIDRPSLVRPIKAKNQLEALSKAKRLVKVSVVRKR